tara:strand:- start:1705 stop:2154 length:450 start_codon:yes stop_codon:yes gene_type:complete
LIDPVSAFGLITSAHATIKKCVEMGRDLNSAQSAIQKYAQGEAELGFAKEKKRKSIFGGIMDSAIDKHLKEEEQRRLKDELRSIFQLYGSPGQWERLQATIARARAEHKKALEERQRQRDIIIKTLVVLITVSIGFVALFYFAKYLKGY